MRVYPEVLKKRLYRVMCYMSLALSLGVSAFASPANAQTYFRSETDGLPTGTELGVWSTDDESATLHIQGGHLAGETRFVAGWITPFAQRAFHLEFDLTTIGPFGGSTDIYQKLRYREAQGRWSKWLRFPLSMNTQTDSVSGGIMHDSRGPAVQFEWRLGGSVQDISYLGGWVDASVR